MCVTLKYFQSKRTSWFFFTGSTLNQQFYKDYFVYTL